MISLLISALVQAEPVYVRAEDLPPYNIQLFNPSIDSQRTFLLSEAWMDPSVFGGAFARVSMHSFGSPLRYTPFNRETKQLVGGGLQSDVILGYLFENDLRIAADIPLILFEGEYSRTGLGDIRFDVKYVFTNPDTSPVSVAMNASVSVPTATMGTPFSDNALTYGGGICIDRIITKNIMWHINAGYRYQSETEYENFMWGSTLNIGSGVSYHFLKGDVLNMGGVGEVLLRNHLFHPFDMKYSVLDGFMGGWVQLNLDDVKPLHFRIGLGNSFSATPGSAARLHLDSTYYF